MIGKRQPGSVRKINQQVSKEAPQLQDSLSGRVVSCNNENVNSINIIQCRNNQERDTIQQMKEKKCQDNEMSFSENRNIQSQTGICPKYKEKQPHKISHQFNTNRNINYVSDQRNINENGAFQNQAESDFNTNQQYFSLINNYSDSALNHFNQGQENIQGESRNWNHKQSQSHQETQNNYDENMLKQNNQYYPPYQINQSQYPHYEIPFDDDNNQYNQSDNYNQTAIHTNNNSNNSFNQMVQTNFINQQIKSKQNNYEKRNKNTNQLILDQNFNTFSTLAIQQDRPVVSNQLFQQFKETGEGQEEEGEGQEEEGEGEEEAEEQYMSTQQQNNQGQQSTIIQSTQGNSIVNYNAPNEYGCISNEYACSKNMKNELYELPTTFRRVLNEKGVEYTAREYDRFSNMCVQETELNQMNYYFLPLKIQEQESIIEKSNQNIIELQKAIQILLRRESQLSTDYHDIQQQHLKETQSLLEKHRILTKDNVEKELLIHQLQAQISAKDTQHQLLQNQNRDALSKKIIFNLFIFIHIILFILKLMATVLFLSPQLFLKQYVSQKQKQEFSNFEENRSDLEYHLKESQMKIELMEKENEELKQENRLVREDRTNMIEQIKELEMLVQMRDNKTTQLIIERKNQNDEYSQRQNILIQENQELRKESNALSGQNRKMGKNLLDYKEELCILKQTLNDLACSTEKNNLTVDDSTPIAIVIQCAKQIKQQLQSSINDRQKQSQSQQKQQEITFQQVKQKLQDTAPQQQSNQKEGITSTFRIQELD